MARSLISSAFCSWVLATTSSSAISALSSSSSSPSLSPPCPLTAVGALPPTRLGVFSPAAVVVAAAAAASSPSLVPLDLRPRLFLLAPPAVTPLATLPLTCDVASTDGERAIDERPSGGKDVWRRGWWLEDTLPASDGFLRLLDGPGAAASALAGRFLLGSCADAGAGGDMAVGDMALLGGDAISVDVGVVVATGGEEISRLIFILLFGRYRASPSPLQQGPSPRNVPRLYPSQEKEEACYGMRQDSISSYTKRVDSLIVEFRAVVKGRCAARCDEKME